MPAKTFRIGETAPAPEPKPAPAQRGKRLRLRILLPLLAVTAFLAASFYTSYIASESMLPTLKVGDHALTMRDWLAYPYGRIPGRGDIILFRVPPGVLEEAENRPANKRTRGKDLIAAFRALQEDILIKRVVAVPGEEVQIKPDGVYVNGQRLREDYPTLPASAEEIDLYPYAGAEPFTVPTDQLFVLGVNRERSEDSRIFGPVQRDWIVGKFIRVLYNRPMPESGNG
jgi:signal peptidase I